MEVQGKALLKASEDGNLGTVNALLQVSHPWKSYICVCVCVCARSCGEGECSEGLKAVTTHVEYVYIYVHDHG